MKFAVVGIDWLKTALEFSVIAIRLNRNAKMISPPTLNRRELKPCKIFRMFPRSLHCNSRAREVLPFLGENLPESFKADFHTLVSNVVMGHHAIFPGT